jgi:hypothetical protein
MISWWQPVASFRCSGSNCLKRSETAAIGNKLFTCLTKLSSCCGSWDLRAKPSAPAAQFQQGRSLVMCLELLVPNHWHPPLQQALSACGTSEVRFGPTCAFCLKAASAQRVRFVLDTEGKDPSGERFSPCRSLCYIFSPYFTALLVKECTSMSCCNPAACMLLGS